MKIFLAGATGVIGRALVPRLVKEGHEVAGMTNDASKGEMLRALGARPVVVDVFNREALFAAVKDARPDALIHELTSLRMGDYAVNNRIRIEGTRNLVDAAQAAGVRRIVAQSYCFYAPKEGLARESDPLDLESGAYGESIAGILAVEQMVGEVPEGVILRYGTLYGPGTWFARDGFVADQIRNGKPGPIGDVISFLHVEDAARAALLALAWPKGVVNIVDDEPTRAVDWVPVFAAAIGAPTPPIKATGDVHPGVSNAKARRELGWEPLYPSWREGFKTALAGPESGPESVQRQAA